MTDHTLREKIEALKFEVNPYSEARHNHTGFNAGVDAALRILDAHTAAQPAPDGVAEADDALLSDAYIAMRDAMGVIDANEGPGMKHSRILNALADARVRIERRTSAKGPSA